MSSGDKNSIQRHIHWNLSFAMVWFTELKYFWKRKGRLKLGLQCWLYFHSLGNSSKVITDLLRVDVEYLCRGTAGYSHKSAGVHLPRMHSFLPYNRESIFSSIHTVRNKTEVFWAKCFLVSIKCTMSGSGVLKVSTKNKNQGIQTEDSVLPHVPTTYIAQNIICIDREFIWIWAAII